MNPMATIKSQLRIPIKIENGGLELAMEQVAALLNFSSIEKLEKESGAMPGVFATVFFSRKVTKNGKTYRFGINRIADGMSECTVIFLSPMKDEINVKDFIHSFEIEEYSDLIPSWDVVSSFESFFSQEMEVSKG